MINMKSKGIMLILICNLIATICMLPWLPDKIPSQWDIQWNVASYQSKYFLIIIAFLPILIYILQLISSKKSEEFKRKSEMKSYQIIWMGSIIFLLVVQWAMIFVSKNSEIQMKVILLSSLGVLLIVMGNYMPVIKSNHYVGIRNPWTIRNDKVWKKTHRIGGYLFIAMGMFYIPMAVFDVMWLQYMGAGLLLIVVFGLNIYSYILYIRNK